MSLHGRRRDAVRLLRARGSHGITAAEAFKEGFGNDWRRIMTDIVRAGYTIEKKWEKGKNARWIRYSLVGERTEHISRIEEMKRQFGML